MGRVLYVLAKPAIGGDNGRLPVLELSFRTQRAGYAVKFGAFWVLGFLAKSGGKTAFYRFSGLAKEFLTIMRLYRRTNPDMTRPKNYLQL